MTSSGPGLEVELERDLLKRIAEDPLRVALVARFSAQVFDQDGLLDLCEEGVVRVDGPEQVSSGTLGFVLGVEDCLPESVPYLRREFAESLRDIAEVAHLMSIPSALKLASVLNG